MHATLPKRKTAKAASKPQSPMPVEEQLTGDGDELSVLDQDDRIIEIELVKIKPHEQNRDLDGDQSIEELAESIRLLGQLEPATVRELFQGEYSYEMLSGERRYRALKKLGRATIRAVVTHDDRTEGLVRLAGANSQRRDLNAIERAELIVQLMKPVKDGGSGLSREAAGKAVGLNSDSGTKNALRMLRLPKAIKTLVTGGELSERASRKLIPFVDHPQIVKDIERNLAHEEHRVELATEEGWPYWLETAVENHTRPMDDAKINASSLVKGCYQRYPMLFTPTDEQLEQLAPFHLQDGKQTRQLTSNTKLWDSLQKPLVEEKFNESRSPKKSDKKTAKATETKLTTAQEKSEAARKKKEANERIERFTAQWITYALRCQLAHQTTDEVRYATLGYLVQAMSSKWDVCHAVDLGYAESGLKTKKVAGAHGQDGPEKMIEANEYSYLEAWWNCMIWPEPASGNLPDLEKLPGISGKAVRVLAARCNVTMKDFWTSATSIHGYQRDLLALWLGRHTTEQLLDMCQSMSLKPTVSKRSELVECLIGQHLPNRMLPFPKGIAT
jgi:ParB family chromosome partitioning protein